MKRLEALHCLTADSPDLTHAEQAKVFFEGGARWIQMRAKNLGFDGWLSEAWAARHTCSSLGATFIVNDSVEVARLTKADGVHLGKTDASPADARLSLGSGAIIGCTVNSLADARRVVAVPDCDYAGVGPYRHTETKANLAPVLSREELSLILAILSDAGIPAIVIGGIQHDDLADIAEAGASGVAVCSTLRNGDDPRHNVRRFLEAWKNVSSRSSRAA